MDALHYAAVLGLLCLVIGVFLVNIVHHPSASLTGTIVAAIGVLMLVIVAVGQLLA